MEYYLQALVPYPWQLQSYLLQYIVTILLFVRSIYKNTFYLFQAVQQSKQLFQLFFPHESFLKPHQQLVELTTGPPCPVISKQHNGNSILNKCSYLQKKKPALPLLVPKHHQVRDLECESGYRFVRFGKILALRLLWPLESSVKSWILSISFKIMIQFVLFWQNYEYTCTYRHDFPKFLTFSVVGYHGEPRFTVFLILCNFKPNHCSGVVSIIDLHLNLLQVFFFVDCK